MKVAMFRTIVATLEYECQAYKTYSNGDIDRSRTRTYKWVNTNRMLNEKGYNGLKTGITEAAGPCLSASYEAKGYHFVMVILNSKSTVARWQEIP